MARNHLKTLDVNRKTNIRSDIIKTRCEGWKKDPFGSSQKSAMDLREQEKKISVFMKGGKILSN
jgi:hypothetical protein